MLTPYKNDLKCHILQNISYFISTWSTSEFLSFSFLFSFLLIPSKFSPVKSFLLICITDWGSFNYTLFSCNWFISFSWYEKVHISSTKKFRTESWSICLYLIPILINSIPKSIYLNKYGKTVSNDTLFLYNFFIFKEPPQLGIVWAVPNKRIADLFIALQWLHTEFA